MFIDKLHRAGERYALLEHLIALPETVSDTEKYTALMKEYNALAPLVEKIREYTSCENRLNEAQEMLRAGDDPDLRELAQEEAAECRARLPELEHELRLMLIPPDPNDEKNVIVEIRAGTGGEEAALFAAELYRMYLMYAEKHGFICETVETNETELGGFKKVVFLVTGKGAYSKFRFESGAHRVQRVPETESNGRLQTSAATVAVMPEAEDVQIEINPADITFETMKSTGAGGQHINKTLSAVRLIHKPSGIVIECQQERSQLQNKEKALRMLKARLYDEQQRAQDEQIASDRKSQVGTGDRSGKIRTYNYRESRVTDHRIGLTLYTLPAVLNGDLDEIVNALAADEAARRLAAEDADG